MTRSLGGSPDHHRDESVPGDPAVAPYPVLVHTVVERLREAARGLADEPVTFAYLFGSRVTGSAWPDSDTDIAVLPVPGLSREQRRALRDRIANIFEVPARSEVDVVLLDEAPLPLRGRVLRQREVLYSADEPLRVRWESLTGRMFADSRLKLDELDRELLARTATGCR